MNGKRICYIGVALMTLTACSNNEEARNKAPEPLMGQHFGLAVTEKLGQQDRDNLHQLTLQSLNALPDGASREWSNPVDGTSGVITIMSTITEEGRGQCRLFAQKFYQNGAIEKAQGEACLDEEKGWILQTWTPG